MTATADQIIRGLQLQLDKAREENRQLREQLKWSGYRRHQEATISAPGGDK